MKKLTKENLFILVLLLILAVGSVTLVTYPNTNTTYYTKEELREMIVGTGLNYLYKNSYSDYNQTSFTESAKVKNASGSTITMFQSYNPRNFNTTAEKISRTNKYFIDCTSFVGTIYINALGYDFSKYYDNALDHNGGGTKPVQYFSNDSYVAANKSKENFITAYKYHGKGNASGFFHSIGAEYANTSNNPYTNDLVSNKTPVVYYYKTPEEKGAVVPVAARKKLLNVLRKGDIIVYQSYNSSGKLVGHALLFIGDELSSSHQAKLGDETINNIGGVIHSNGNDFNLNKENDYGYDDFSVRYNSMNFVLNKLANNKINQVTVLRPVNDLCNGTKDKCNISLSKTQLAHGEFSQLSTEQYASIKKTYKFDSTYQRESNEEKEKTYTNTLSAYNSVNKGDEIIYNFIVSNKNDYGFCSSDSPKDHPTKKSCEAAKYTWITRESSKRKSYDKFTITATIPSNTKFVSCDGCTNSNGTLTWNISIGSTREKKISYTVKVQDKNNDIVNNGFVIKNSKATLNMGKMTTKVNPTFNGINIQIMRKDIDTIKKMFNNKIITYSNSSSNNYKQKLSTITNTSLTSTDFVKLIYYSEMNLDLGYLTADNIKQAVFKSLSTIKNVNDVNLTASDFYVKRTDKEIETLTNEDYKKINNIVVKGMYGGVKLQGNENLDRAGFIRTFDFQMGDIIAIYNKNNLDDMKLYIFGGFENDNPILYSFDEQGLQTHNPKHKDSGYKIIKTIYDSGLFVVLRPTQYHGTTIKLNYIDKVLTDKSFVTRGTYNYLPSSEKKYQITLNYNDNKTQQSTVTGISKLEWYTDNKYIEKVSNTTSLKSTTTHTLYSKWGGVDITTPTREGYSFAGWYTDSSLTKKVSIKDGKYEINKNITLYAKWSTTPINETPAPQEKPEENIVVYPNTKDNEIIIEIPSHLKPTKDDEGIDVYKYDETIGDYQQVDYIKEAEKLIIKHDFSKSENAKVYIKKYKIVNGEKNYDIEENTKLEIPIEVNKDDLPPKENTNLNEEIEEETVTKKDEVNKEQDKKISNKLILGIILIISLLVCLILLFFKQNKKKCI